MSRPCAVNRTRRPSYYATGCWGEQRGRTRSHRNQPKDDARQASDPRHAHHSRTHLRKIAEGADENALLEAYPKLTREDIHAAFLYAADALAHEEVLLGAAG